MGKKMENWREIWERKGRYISCDLKFLDGFEDTEIDFYLVVCGIVESLKIGKEDSILEVGCGAGALAQYFKSQSYVGIDYSKSMVRRHIELLRNSVLYGEADDLPFKNKSFDHVICFSVFQYFPDKEYAMEALKEFSCVARKGIYIGDIPERSHRESHLTYQRDLFQGGIITEGFYTKDRFNVYWRLV